ncbi:hypothetical protein R3P38DRAFT_3610450 [Favolaschia claudopus]|uniref:DUF4246 domain-containing protein n=1 Tax=Favolaschia claudopus TaxID=2862362 RepID=A0AAW0A6V2_9AGAR
MPPLCTIFSSSLLLFASTTSPPPTSSPLPSFPALHQRSASTSFLLFFSTTIYPSDTAASIEFILGFQRRRDPRGAIRGVVQVLNRVLDAPRARNLPSVSGAPDASNTFEFWIQRSRDRADALKCLKFDFSRSRDRHHSLEFTNASYNLRRRRDVPNVSRIWKFDFSHSAERGVAFGALAVFQFRCLRLLATDATPQRLPPPPTATIKTRHGNRRNILEVDSCPVPSNTTRQNFHNSALQTNLFTLLRQSACSRSPGAALRGKTIQCIIKLANIHLTPENPVYEGGSWHIEVFRSIRLSRVTGP